MKSLKRIAGVLMLVAVVGLLISTANASAELAPTQKSVVQKQPTQKRVVQKQPTQKTAVQKSPVQKRAYRTKRVTVTRGRSTRTVTVTREPRVVTGEEWVVTRGPGSALIYTQLRGADATAQPEPVMDAWIAERGGRFAFRPWTWGRGVPRWHFYRPG